MALSEPLSRAQYKAARHLLTRKGREDAREFIAEGPQAVSEALRDPAGVRLIITDDRQQHADLWQHSSVSVRIATPEEIAALSGTVSPQGVLAVCALPQTRLTDIDQARLVAICSQIRDPGNAGTVIRSADAFGADAVITTSGSVDPWHPRTVRASVGGVFHLPIVAGVDLDEAIDWARGRGMQVWAADAGGASLDDLGPALGEPTAWVFGNEAWGFDPVERDLVDRVVSVPMWGQAESLNLATAAAVCLYSSAQAARSEFGRGRSS